jgi:hypothetical protein
MGGPNALLSLEEGAKGIVWAATLPADGATGGFFHHGEPMPWPERSFDGSFALVPAAGRLHFLSLRIATQISLTMLERRRYAASLEAS